MQSVLYIRQFFIILCLKYWYLYACSELRLCRKKGNCSDRVCYFGEGCQIYSRCEDSCRLNEKGNLNVPADKTDIFCQGPCLSETNLVLNCLNNVFSNFIFYNNATIHDIRDTVEAACGYGPQRGTSFCLYHCSLKQLHSWKTNLSETSFWKFRKLQCGSACSERRKRSCSKGYH